MSRTVFISNRSRDHTYKSAEKYGSLAYITQGKYPIFKTDLLLREIIKVLLHSEEEDYLILSGSSGISGLVFGIWILMHKKARLLIYDPSVRGYVERTFKRETVQLSIETARDRSQET